MYEINLLPPKLQKRFTIDIKKMIVPVAITIVLLSIFGSYGAFLFKMYSTNKEINTIEAQLTEITPQVKEIEQMKAENLNTEKKIQAYKQIIDQRTIITPILNDIAYNMPVDMWLTDVSLENQKEYAPRGGFASPTGVLAEFEKQKNENKGNSNQNQNANQNSDQTTNQTNNQNANQSNNQNNNQEQAKEGEEEQTEEVPPPNVLVLGGISYSPASIGVLINNLSQLPYFQSVDLIETSTTKDKGLTGYVFSIESKLREVKQNVSKS